MEKLDFGENLPVEQRPFVELRIRLEKPGPGLRQQVEEVISKLPVRLLKISTAYGGKDNSLADVKVEERLEELQPLEVFQRCYQNKFDQEAPEIMNALFHELLENLLERITGTDIYSETVYCGIRAGQNGKRRIKPHCRAYAESDPAGQ